MPADVLRLLRLLECVGMAIVQAPIGCGLAVGKADVEHYVSRARRLTAWERRDRLLAPPPVSAPTTSVRRACRKAPTEPVRPAQAELQISQRWTDDHDW